MIRSGSLASQFPRLFYGFWRWWRFRSFDRHRTWISCPFIYHISFLLASFLQSLSSAKCTHQYGNFCSCESHSTCPFLFPSLMEFSWWRGHMFSDFNVFLWQMDYISGIDVASANCSCHGPKTDTLDGQCWGERLVLHVLCTHWQQPLDWFLFSLHRQSVLDISWLCTQAHPSTWISSLASSSMEGQGEKSGRKHRSHGIPYRSWYLVFLEWICCNTPLMTLPSFVCMPLFSSHLPFPSLAAWNCWGRGIVTSRYSRCRSHRLEPFACFSW